MQDVEFQSDNAIASYDHPPPPGWVDLIRQCIGGAEVDKPAVDIGCGPGRFLPEIARLTSSIVVGVDRSASMLLRARSTFGALYPLVRADAERLPLRSGSSGIVVLRYVAHHVSNINAMLVEAARVLDSGGKLVLESADPERLRLKPEYSLFSEFGAKALCQWPSWDALASAATGAGLKNISRSGVRLVRASLTPAQHLERTRQWAQVGGGTSFWRQLDHAQRHLYLKAVEEQVSAMPVDATVPVLTESVMLVAERK
jgi:SAM-dependent methyltransferase